jgi:hypothetical protein
VVPVQQADPIGAFGDHPVPAEPVPDAGVLDVLLLDARRQRLLTPDREDANTGHPHASDGQRPHLRERRQDG